MVGQPINQPDGARGVGEDGVPVAEGQVGGQHNGLLLVATRHDLEEQVFCGVRVVRQVANFVNAEQLRAGVVAQAPVEACDGAICAVSRSQNPGRSGRETPFIAPIVTAGARVAELERLLVP